jgi:hypothetical protein
VGREERLGIEDPGEDPLEPVELDDPEQDSRPTLDPSQHPEPIAVLGPVLEEPASSPGELLAAAELALVEQRGRDERDETGDRLSWTRTAGVGASFTST